MKKRYISIFLIVILIVSVLIYHLYPQNMKDIILEDRNIVDSIKIFSFDNETAECDLIILEDNDLTSFFSLLEKTNAHHKILKKDTFSSAKYYRFLIHEADIDTNSKRCAIEYYAEENIITVNGAQYAINDPNFPNTLEMVLAH